MGSVGGLPLEFEQGQQRGMNLDHRVGIASSQTVSRAAELARVQSLFEQARHGQGGALFIEGQPGNGKTALLEKALATVGGMVVLRVDGIEVESTLASAGLSRLQRRLKRFAPTRSPGRPAWDDPLGAGLVLLEQLCRLSEDRPVAVVGDDAHWLDRFTLDVFGIVARRIEEQPIAFLLAGEPQTRANRSLTGVDVIVLDEAFGAKSLLEPGYGRAGFAEVAMLGEFAVRTSGRPVRISDGLAATLLKVVALKGHVPAEEVEEILWPGAQPGLGRARMRNVVHRIRTSCGPLVVRDGRTLRLAPGVRVDVHVFEETAIKAIVAVESGVVDAAEMAWDAISLYTGELLPVDRHADWAAAARERLARLYFSLFDTLEMDASKRGEIAEALQVIERAIELDPYDEARYLRGAKLLAGRGSTSLALSMIRRGQAAMGRLGLPTSPAVAEMLETLSE